MARPADVKFLKSHEWARTEGDTVTVGISDFAVDALNKEIVYVELPEIGRKVQQGQSFGVIESVKAASDLYAPVSGTVTAANQAVVSDPNVVSEDPYGAGWMVKIRADNSTDIDGLLSPEAYEKVCAEEAH
ncbi:MAG: glycine cleavage system protein GcvH [Candidatus Sumerlaeaceae bacterium]